AGNIAGADVVVASSAVPRDNPEVQAALAARVPVVARAEMLGELMRFRYSIAVAGTHGKTTTTSLIASILSEGGEDPTYVIGGRLKSGASNARLGAGRYLVAEADESDASFTHLQPLIAVVTNIDNDHLSTHGGDFGLLKQSFADFLHNLPFYGLAVLCADDAHTASIVEEVGRPILFYGLSPGADVRGTNLRPAGLKTRFEVARRDSAPLDVQLNLPGTHNVANALAAIAVTPELGGDRDRGERVRDVMSAGEIELHVERRAVPSRHLEARLEARRAEIRAAHVGARREAVEEDRPSHLLDDARRVRIVRAQHRETVERQVVEEISEALLEEPEIATVGGEVIVVDVGDDRDQRLKVREGGVALVGLGHEVTPGAEPRVARAA